MEIKRLDKTFETQIGFKEALAVIESNRARVRNLCNMILTSCSIFLSSSFVVLFFLVKEVYLNNSIIILLLALSDLMLIIAIFFTVSSAYIKAPKPITTEIALVSYQSSYYLKEQRNSKYAIMFLFAGVVTFLVSLIFFALKVIN